MQCFDYWYRPNAVLDNSYHIDNNVLPEVTSCRDLGVTITNDLSPTLHINEIVRKAHQRANAILRCFEIRDNVLLVNAFNTMFAQLWSTTVSSGPLI